MHHPQELQSEWELATDTVAVAAERVWTSTKPFSDGREFCSIFNQAIREDRADVAPYTAIIARATNLNLTVARGATAVLSFPPMGITWRGDGFMDSADTRAFFTPDKVRRLQVCLLT
jgi:hypothetical protein